MKKQYIDFKMLEYKSDEELKTIIEKSEEEYLALNNYIQRYEDDLEMQYKNREIDYFTYQALLPKCELLIQKLANLESYIRKASNMLYNYDRPTRGFDKMDRDRKLKFNLENKRKVTPKLQLKFK